MGSNFRIATEIKTDQASWGHSRWVSNPASTGARQLTFLDAMLAPGQAHSFHKHPSQEEVMYVVAGNVEQWIDREKRVLGAGDAAFIPAGMVHATFNTGKTEAHLLWSSVHAWATASRRSTFQATPRGRDSGS